MRSASPAVKALLASGAPMWIADCYTVTLQETGEIFRWTTYDQSLTVGGDTWSASGPQVTTKGWRLTNTTEIPQLRCRIGSTGTDLAGSVNLKQIAAYGLLDGATWLVQRLYMPSPADVSGGFVDLWLGVTGDVEITATGLNVTVLAGSNDLVRYMPSNRYSAGCTWSLYGEGCALTRSDWTATATVGPGSTTQLVQITGSWLLGGVTPISEANLVLGTVTFQSGAAAGQSRTIVAAAAGSITMMTPLDVVPASGVGVTAVYGCDHTRDGAQGCAKFANQQHFRGFRYIPPATTAY